MLRYDGKVAIVTGAGGGLGRTYALHFAERGAAVVVNDLGGDRHGGGAGSQMADQVVAEIKRKGGKAVPNYNSVEDGDKIVKTAIDNFGRIDIVINNAGILRDKSFLNMTEQDWDLIQRVHLKGAYSVTKAAWPYMRKNKYGRIIVTSSNAGVHGNFGQANYAAAKAALIGFSNTLSREGAKYNIHCNALVPTAGSRLTETVMPEEAVQTLKPDYVTPLVLWLCHQDCDANGGLYEAGAGWYGQYQYYRSNGVVLKGLATKPEDVRDSWEKIVDMNGARHYSSLDEVSATLFGAIEASRETTAGADSNTEEKFMHFDYQTRDAILYALGVGAQTADDLKYLYEGDENFSVLPTFVFAPALEAQDLSSVTQFEIELSKILHGEQYLEMYKPLPTEGKLKTTSKVSAVLDKGRGALILSDVFVFDAQTGDKLAYAQMSIFHRNTGGFGGPKDSPVEKKIVAVPKRAPDSVMEQKTGADQPALYRQGSGDMNPLHIDPNFAAIAGLKQPIMHGLCSLGFAVRHVIKTYAENDSAAFKAVKARFSKPVIPGQTLVTEMWRENSRIHFQTKVKETGEVAISSGYVDLHSVTSAAPAKPTSKSNLQSAAVFDQLRKRLSEQPDLVKKVNGVFLWVITQGGKEAARYTVDLKTGAGAIYEGEPKPGVRPGVTLTLDDENMVKLVTGKLNPQQAFMSGKLKLKGNIMLTQKLQNLIGDKAKL